MATEPDLAYLNESLVPNMIICASICGPAAVVFVAMRIYSRYLAFGYPRLDLSDWLLVAAFLFFSMFVITFGLIIKYGAGRHALAVSDRHLLQVLSIIGETIYFWSLASIKLSILCLYGAIFPVPHFHWYLRAVGTFMIAWTLQGTFVTIFQCTPIEYGWNRDIPGGFCINYGVMVLVAGICNIITDFVILLMPIPLVLKLQVSKQKKRIIIFTFALGGSACIVSICRLAYSLQLGAFDGSWTGIPASMVSIAEMMAGMLAASIPTYAPIYRIWLLRSSTRNKSYADSEARARTPVYTNSCPPSVRVTGNRVDANPGPGIKVTSNIELVRHTYANNGTWVRVPEEEEVRLFEPKAMPHNDV
ncbi:hypothetical protein F4779DRAFT_575771 [Xylariaceae sp. FL0662B]|nr:hypothetical protein F4779DRAFT_575771 [Xylariaceae sp. FL0662B]